MRFRTGDHVRVSCPGSPFDGLTGEVVGKFHSDVNVRLDDSTLVHFRPKALNLEAPYNAVFHQARRKVKEWIEGKRVSL